MPKVLTATAAGSNTQSMTKVAERPISQRSKMSSRGESRQDKVRYVSGKDDYFLCMQCCTQKRKEKRAKRRSRHSTGEVVPPKLKKKSRGSRQSITAGESMKHLEAFILSLCRSFDQQNSGYIDPSVFWQVRWNLLCYI